MKMTIKLHASTIWGSGNREREVKDFQWNEEEFSFSEDLFKSRYHPTWVLNMHREKKITHSKFFDFRSKNVNRNRFQEIKIGPWEGFEKKAFFSLFLMRKRLSGGQKWFLRPYFPLIKGIFVFRSGLRFSFRALEVGGGIHSPNWM